MKIMIEGTLLIKFKSFFAVGIVATAMNADTVSKQNSGEAMNGHSGALHWKLSEEL